MPTDGIRLDSAEDATHEDQAQLISEAFASGDTAFVWAALRTVLRARHLGVDTVMPDDPSLSVVLEALDRLGLVLVATRKAQ